MDSKRLKLSESDGSPVEPANQTIMQPQNVADEFSVSIALDKEVPDSASDPGVINSSELRVGDTAKHSVKDDAYPEPKVGICQFYLKRKRRYCKSMPAKDKPYCVEHSHLLGVRFFVLCVG